MLVSRELLKTNNNVKEINIVRKRFYKARLCWNLHSSSQNDGLIVQIQDLNDLKQQWIINLDQTVSFYDIPFDLAAGHSYLAYVCTTTICDMKGVAAYQVQQEAKAEFRAELTKEELLDLSQRCLNFMMRKHSKYLPFRYLYRNKPFEYWNNILRYNNGIMEVYAKDMNGDPASLINNGIVDGLFFGACVEASTGLPSTTSHFGPQRLLVPVQHMITPDSNLYFADFYCNHKAHYVTLVLTKKGSNTDKFCEEKLLPLNKFDNKYIKLVRVNVPSFVSERYVFYITCNIWVEILYTEDIDIPYALRNCEAYWQITDSTGTSRPLGIPKNPNCKTCNLYK